MSKPSTQIVNLHKKVKYIPADRINEVWEEYDSTRLTQEDLSIFRLKFYIPEALAYGYEKGYEDAKAEKD